MLYFVLCSFPLSSPPYNHQYILCLSFNTCIKVPCTPAFYMPAKGIRNIKIMLTGEFFSLTLFHYATKFERKTVWRPSALDRVNLVLEQYSVSLGISEPLWCCLAQA